MSRSLFWRLYLTTNGRPHGWPGRQPSMNRDTTTLFLSNGVCFLSFLWGRCSRTIIYHLFHVFPWLYWATFYTYLLHCDLIFRAWFKSRKRSVVSSAASWCIYCWFFFFLLGTLRFWNWYIPWCCWFLLIWLYHFSHVICWGAGQVHIYESIASISHLHTYIYTPPSSFEPVLSFVYRNHPLSIRDPDWIILPVQRILGDHNTVREWYVHSFSIQNGPFQCRWPFQCSLSKVSNCWYKWIFRATKLKVMLVITISMIRWRKGCACPYLSTNPLS